MTKVRASLGLLLLVTAPTASAQSLCNPCVDPPVRNARPVTGLMPGEREIIDAEEFRRLSGPAPQARVAPFNAQQLRDMISELEELLEESREGAPGGLLEDAPGSLLEDAPGSVLEEARPDASGQSPEAARRLRFQEALRQSEEQLQNLMRESERTDDGNDD